MMQLKTFFFFCGNYFKKWPELDEMTNDLEIFVNYKKSPEAVKDFISGYTREKP